MVGTHWSHSLSTHYTKKMNPGAKDNSALVLERMNHACRYGDLDAVKDIFYSTNGDLNQKDIAGNPPVCVASRYKQWEIVRYLVDNGFPVNSTDRFKMTPLHWACIHNEEFMVADLMRKNADDTVEDTLGLTAPLQACIYGHSKIIAIFLMRINNPYYLHHTQRVLNYPILAKVFDPNIARDLVLYNYSDAFQIRVIHYSAKMDPKRAKVMVEEPSPPPQGTIKLIPKEGNAFAIEVSKHTATASSNLINEMLDDNEADEDEVVRLPSITHKTLTRIVEYMEQYVDATKPTFKLEGKIDELREIVLAAGFLEIKALYDNCIDTLAVYVANNQPVQISNMFKVSMPSTEETIEYYKYAKWIFQKPKRAVT